MLPRTLAISLSNFFEDNSSVISCSNCSSTLNEDYQINLFTPQLKDLEALFNSNETIILQEIGGNESMNKSVVISVPSPLGVSIFEAIATVIILGFIILGTIFGNILVILSVFTYRPLRNVQNMFIVSLAVADITVAVLVMPLNVTYSIMERWIFGLVICEIWLTCDVLCCTASILNLCAIALDRYWAIHDPINYARKRTLQRVLLMILLVWAISTLISVPPLIGWNDWPDIFTEMTPCMLTEERGYVIYSASGSFYIPLIIMTIVYLKIFQAAKRRLRVKAKASGNVKTVGKNGMKLKCLNSKTSKNDKENEIPSATLALVSSANKMIDLKALAAEYADDASTWSATMEDQNSSDANNPVKEYMESKARISLSKERRAARVLGIVMGVFVLCWLPFFLMYVILPFCGGCYISPRVVQLLTWLGYVNSALNPVIYTIFNNDFRKAFHKLLFRKR